MLANKVPFWGPPGPGCAKSSESINFAKERASKSHDKRSRCPGPLKSRACWRNCGPKWLKVSVRDVEGKRGHPGSGFRRSPRAGAGTEGPPAGTPGHPRGPGALLPACVATFVGGPGLVPKSPMRPLSAVHWASAAWSLARQAAQARTRARTAASRNRRHGPREAPAGPGWPRACQGVARDASRPPYGQIGVDVEGGPPLYVIPPRPEPRPLNLTHRPDDGLGLGSPARNHAPPNWTTLLA